LTYPFATGSSSSHFFFRPGDGTRSLCHFLRTDRKWFCNLRTLSTSSLEQKTCSHRSLLFRGYFLSPILMLIGGRCCLNGSCRPSPFKFRSNVEEPPVTWKQRTEGRPRPSDSLQIFREVLLDFHPCWGGISSLS